MKKSPPHVIDPSHFKGALSQFATGVTVITTRMPNGNFWGITASSFNSVSLDPPLILWSLSDVSSTLPLFTVNSHYVVNVLAANQKSVADQFSASGKDRFQGIEYSLSPNGYPVIAGAIAWFECSNRRRYPEGDHIIFVGAVEKCEFTPGAPLLYHGGQLLGSD